MSQLENNQVPVEVDWREQLAAHSPWLRSVVYSRLGEPQAVDDVMQEIALALVEKPPTGVQVQKTAPYLYRMAVRQALLFRRKSGRRHRKLNNYAEHAASNSTASYDPLEILLADERQQLIRQAIGSLNPRDSEILLMKYTTQSSYRQIAQLLGVSESAVETRLHRARKRMRTALAALQVIENVNP